MLRATDWTDGPIDAFIGGFPLVEQTAIDQKAELNAETQSTSPIRRESPEHRDLETTTFTQADEPSRDDRAAADVSRESPALSNEQVDEIVENYVVEHYRTH